VLGTVVFGCGFSVVSCRLWVVGCEFSVVGCGLSQALFQSSQIAIGALNL
jgi:predicted small metal-binding protein